MDHNLDDPLSLESAIGVDFHSEDIEVSQADITLNTSGHDDDINMQFEQIEEQPMLMDTGNEEIIELMGSEQFTLQEYSIHDDQLTGAHAVVETSSTSQSLASKIAYDTTNTNIIHVQAAPSHHLKKLLAQKPVAIAPRPPRLAPLPKSVGPSGKLYAIAPKPVSKPVALIANKSMLGKKVSVTGLSKQNNNVFAQIGRQFVMLPGSGGQKIKLVSSPTNKTLQLIKADSEKGQSLASKTAASIQQAKLTKVVMQAINKANASTSDASSTPAPALLSKVVPVSAANTQQTHYVMQQKTIPISKANMVLMGSPTKKTVKISNKPQVVTIVKSPNTGQPTTKKVVITANPPQNVILRTTAPPKTATINKDGTITTAQGQQTQLHQINVPGKGIQYIRLITTPTSSVSTITSSKVKPVSANQASVLTLPSNLIQMSADKVGTTQPPPLVLTGTPAKINKVTSKPIQKLVRIAPLTKATIPVSTSSQRSSQSLLAPLPSPAGAGDVGDAGDSARGDVRDAGDAARRDCKEELRALIAQTVARQDRTRNIEIEFDRRRSSAEESNSNSMDAAYEQHAAEDHPLIVVPNFKQEQILPDDSLENSPHITKMEISLEGGVLLSAYPDDDGHDPGSNPDEGTSADLLSRGRKACNCTKSQCLKLYCDCFANGEFCNRCNCVNCHNNLENEELRQKAIRGCLERNPRAFRPKIGKAKTAGPDMIRRHTKGCNCKRSGCLKNYCECFEAKIACTAKCKCVGCRNVEESLERRRSAPERTLPTAFKQPCSFMTTEVIEAVCQCLLAASVEGPRGEGGEGREGGEAAGEEGARRVLTEFSRCLQDIISAAHQPAPFTVLDQGHA